MQERCRSMWGAAWNNTVRSWLTPANLQTCSSIVQKLQWEGSLDTDILWLLRNEVVKGKLEIPSNDIHSLFDKILFIVVEASEWVSLMLGKIEGRRRRGWPGMAEWHYQLNGHECEQTWEIVKDREAWHAAVHGVAKSWHEWPSWVFQDASETQAKVKPKNQFSDIWSIEKVYTEWEVDTQRRREGRGR